MAGQLQPISLLSPGFLGLNTQDAKVGLDSGYAIKANNCIIDQYGRLGSRKGYTLLTTTPGDLGATNNIEALYEFKTTEGNTVVFSAGNLKFYTGTTTLVTSLFYIADQVTPVSLTFTANRWQYTAAASGLGVAGIINGFAVQKSHRAMVYRKATSGALSGTYIWQRIGTDGFGLIPTGVTTFDPDTILSAYGRTWVAGLTENKHTIFFSKLLDPSDFSSSGSGVLDISSVVGNSDEIVGLAQHNGFLIIFCKENILIYSGADDPTTMVLADTIEGVGCVSRDSIQATGTDLIYLSKSGIRSLKRVVQEKSLPMRELSLNIREDIVDYLAVEPNFDNIKSVYYEKEAFYLLTFPASKIMIYVDLRTELPNGSARITTWSLDNGDMFTGFTATESRKLYIGVPGGIGDHTGYKDNTATYQLVYKSPFSDVGGGVSKKFLKRAKLLVIGSGTQDFTFQYGYDYTLNPRTVVLARDLGTGIYAKFSATTSLYAVSKYSSIGLGVQEISVPLGGHGETFAFGIIATIDDENVSIQKIDLFLKIGKSS